MHGTCQQLQRHELMGLDCRMMMDAGFGHVRLPGATPLRAAGRREAAGVPHYEMFLASSHYDGRTRQARGAHIQQLPLDGSIYASPPSRL